VLGRAPRESGETASQRSNERLAAFDLPQVVVDIGVVVTMAAAVWCVARIWPLFFGRPEGTAA
jgi:hypothetical protein